MVRFNSSLSNEYIRLCKLYEWRSSLRCSMPTYNHYCLFFYIYKYVDVLDKFLYRLISFFSSSIHQPMTTHVVCLESFHLTILLRVCLTMPFVYKVMHIANEHSSSHSIIIVTDRSHLHEFFAFLFILMLDYMLPRLMVRQTTRKNK